MMLAMRLAQTGLEHIPPVTLALVALNSLVFFNPDIVPGLDFGYVEDACIQGAAVVFGFQIHRLWLSAFYHLSDMHLYYNMTSLMWKGRVLERSMGSEGFAQLIAMLTTLSAVIYVAIGFGLAHLGMPGPFHECAAGFSGILFGLKVVVQEYEGGGMRRVFGLPFPVAAQWAYWAELVVIHLMVPQTSLLGHLAGILAGQLWVAWGGLSIVPALRAYFSPPRRYNDAVGHARATAAPLPPLGGVGGAEVAFDPDEPEVIEVAGPPERPVDRDAVRQARVARFGARDRPSTARRQNPDPQPQPRPPRFRGGGVLGGR